MTKVLSEATGVIMALEAALGTAPTTGGVNAWVIMQPNPGGIIEWTPKIKTVERDPLSVYASREKGDVVGLEAMPKLTLDLNKDVIDLFATAMFRSNAKHNGNTGQSLYRPTAVTATGYTVPANGALTNGLLVKAQGFATAANNGQKLLAGTSTGTEIKTTGLTAEAASPANATVDVCGVQGASADITLNASGNLTSTILDFTTLNLQVGQEIKIGGTAANTFFATAAYNGHATVVSVTTNLITLTDRSWTVGSADLGTGKTIQLFFGRFYRNRSLDDADYLEPTHHGELGEQDAGTGGTVPTFTYARALALKTFEINAPLQDKIVATLTFVAIDIADPVLTASRVVGAGTPGVQPSTAYQPNAAALIDTSTDLKDVRLFDSSGNLVAEINSWKLTLEHGTSPRNVQGSLPAIDHNYGKYEPSASMEAYFTSFDQTKAIRDNRDLKWSAFVANHQVGLCFKLPLVAARGGGKKYAANQPVMIDFDVPGFRDPFSNNIVQSLTVFPHIP